MNYSIGYDMRGILQLAREFVRSRVAKLRESHMYDQRKMLKIKLISLADEARTIRKEEKTSIGEEREKLHLHRVNEVRRESRCTHLAYGFIRGTPKLSIERMAYFPPDWKKVEAMVRKYGHPDKGPTSDEFKAWKEA